MNFVQMIVSKLRAFKAANSAVAAVEFALILPLMLTLYMGSIEVSQIISVDRRVSAVAGAVGDLVARTNGTLPASELADYVAASGLIMAPYSSTGLAQLVTVVYVAADGVTTNVEWSVGYNGATARTANSTYTLPAEIRAISANNYVVVSESQMEYTPWGGYFFEGSFTLYKQFFNLPRYGELVGLDTSA